MLQWPANPAAIGLFVELVAVPIMILSARELRLIVRQAAFELEISDDQVVARGDGPARVLPLEQIARIRERPKDVLELADETRMTVVGIPIQDVVGQETQNAFNVNKNAKRVTLEGVINNVSTIQTRAAGTADFAIIGTQVFVNNCQSNGPATGRSSRKPRARGRLPS